MTMEQTGFYLTKLYTLAVVDFAAQNCIISEIEFLLYVGRSFAKSLIIISKSDRG